MSYLQLTLKCGMKCGHCCYSCGPRGKHGDYHTILQGIDFASSLGNKSISIGGGEPALHPQFFNILKKCLEDFDYVWMATNGSQTKIMRRLSNILDGNDYPEDFECDCTEEEIEDGYCNCMEKYDTIYQEGKLGVALSQDYFHDAIDPWVVKRWEDRVRRKHSGYEIRNVTQSRDGASAQGRAKRTGSGWGEHCVCSDILIRPNGKLKLCGCERSPTIGDVWNGIEEKWEKVLQEDESFRDTNCYKSLTKKGRKR